MSEITVFKARKVITMDPGRPFATCVAVKDGRVLSTGTLDTMRPWLERYPHVIDNRFEAMVIMPGFIDPHTHLAGSSSYLELHYVGPIDSPGPLGVNKGLPTRSAVLQRIQELADADNDPNSPLIAWGFDPPSHGGHLCRDDLDQVRTGRPIWIITYAPHIVYLNSAALEWAAVADDAEVHGVKRDTDGRLSGQFVEHEAMALALGAMRDAIMTRDSAQGLRRMADIARKAGITATADMGFGGIDFEADWSFYEAIVSDDSFPLRMALVAIEYSLVANHGEAGATFLAGAMTRNTDKLFLHGVKFLADGSFPAMSLRLNFPGYLDGSNGVRHAIAWEDLPERMLPYWQAAIQIHCHTNGDQAVDAALDALAQLQLHAPRFDHRFTLEHYSISSPDQARRLKALGGCASVNNYFVHYRSQLHAEHSYGPDRSEAVARLGSLAREGVTFALHSDYSFVLVPMHPLTAVWSAITRIGLDGETVMAPGECIDLDRALRAITIDAAHVIGAERQLGSLEPGKLADFAVLHDDPYAVAPAEIRNIPIWGTVLAGRPQPA